MLTVAVEYKGGWRVTGMALSTMWVMQWLDSLIRVT